MPPEATESLTDRVLGLGAVEAAFAAAGGARLRIPAYHGVSDASVFGAHLEHIASRYRPVSGSQVAAALHGGPALPRRAVWVTFDDGRADVVEAGLAELDRTGVPATMFVCPGLVEERKPFWWDVVTGALDAAGPYQWHGTTWTDRKLVVALKKVPDTERRSVVAELETRAGGRADSAAVLTTDQLKRWVGSGHEIGNHSWDHPCLDQCDAAEQRSQVERAHAALTEMLGAAPTLFAYPNGDWAEATEQALVDCGYRVGLLFDHRLGTRSQHPLRVSRLRLDSDAPPRRTAAILSGAHSGFFGLREAVVKRVGRG